MLFTRCPECDTTFRITADALRKADGQVRCGRCACVFDAYTELRRGTSEAYCDDGVVRKALPAAPPPSTASDDAAAADGGVAPTPDRAERSRVAAAGEPVREIERVTLVDEPAPSSGAEPAPTGSEREAAAADAEPAPNDDREKAAAGAGTASKADLGGRGAATGKAGADL